MLADAPRIASDARALQRDWMLPWAEGMLASAVLARWSEGTSEEALRAEVEAAGGRLVDETLIAAHLRSGNAAAALAASTDRLAQLDSAARVRVRWLVQEMQTRHCSLSGGSSTHETLPMLALRPRHRLVGVCSNGACAA